MSWRGCAPALALALFVMAPRAVKAQTLFADGVVFGNLERRDGLDLVGLPANLHQPLELDPVKTSPGGGLAVGARLGSRVSLRLEVGWAATERRVNRQGTLSPPGTQGSSPDLSYSYDVMRRDRLWTWSALVAYHSRRWRRVETAIGGGLAVVAHRVVLDQRLDHVTAITVHPGGLPPGAPTLLVTRDLRQSSTKITDAGLAAVVGVDVDIAMGAHASLVPQVRVLGIRDGVGLRPGVALRARW